MLSLNLNINIPSHSFHLQHTLSQSLTFTHSLSFSCNLKTYRPLILPLKHTYFQRYDRAGYGWSQIAPLGSNTPDIIAARLNLLLSLSGEGNNQYGFIMVGHGAGDTPFQYNTLYELIL